MGGKPAVLINYHKNHQNYCKILRTHRIHVRQKFYVRLATKHRSIVHSMQLADQCICFFSNIKYHVQVSLQGDLEMAKQV